MMDKKTLAIVALIVNLLIPGVGTIIWGETKTGVIQLILYIVGWLLLIVLIGVLVMLASWIWALVSSIKMIQSS